MSDHQCVEFECAERAEAYGLCRRHMRRGRFSSRMPMGNDKCLNCDLPNVEHKITSYGWICPVEPPAAPVMPTLEWQRERRSMDARLVQGDIEAATPAPSPALPVEPTPLADRLAELRAEGWTVAVHNDYRIAGERMTFWLLTHARGVWLKGEGATDEEALASLTGGTGPAQPAPAPRLRDNDELRHVVFSTLVRLQGHAKGSHVAKLLDAIEEALRRGR